MQGKHPMTFVEKERLCEGVFEANGPFWHVYTDGSVQTDIFSNEEELREGSVTGELSLETADLRTEEACKR